MNWVKQARKLAHISAQELADRAGFSRDYIMRMERNDRSVSPKVYEALGFSPQDIPFATDSILRKLKDMPPLVALDYRMVGGMYFYIVDVREGDEISKTLAEVLLENQKNLYER